MYKHKLFLGLGLFLFCVLISPSVFASSSGVVIKRFQAGGAPSGTSQQEFIEIYNDSSEDVDISNWCINHNDSSTNINCFIPPNTQTKLYITTKSSLLVVSPQFIAAYPAVVYDFGYSAGFSTNIPGTNGTIKLTDNLSQTVDRLGWGNGLGEGVAMPGNLTGGQIFERTQDTNDNSADFVVKTPPAALPHGGIYEKVVPVDVCPNISGLNITVPTGYIKDTDGNCYEDICDNIAGLQKVILNGYYRDGIDCKIVELKISELLPNVSGSDTGKEFIEIYNPTSHQVDLSGYILQLGPSYSKNYVLPSFALNPNSLVSLSDTVTKITLPNTSASVKLLTPDSQMVDETAAYQDPGDDQAWALFADSWRYTNQPTPEVVNQESIVVAGMGSGDSDELAACPEGKYRNPDTNRCRNIESDDAGLKPCAIDQVRNAETNRCRSIFAADSGLTACKAGQTRNLETNRCRNATTAINTLKACAANQERNPETNRCRKKAASAIAENNVKDIESEVRAEHGGWLLAGTAGVGLAGYGVAEWREEIALLGRKLASLLGKNPPTD
ncbi:MAG: lamin tail domain-containing protein [Candidatus Saccharibacteria bacterium]|nr:lamin tail domain-containing protein [Candidatus Saccharibacteria bacterium]